MKGLKNYFKKYASNKEDRIAIFSAFSGIINFFLAVLKIVIGLFFSSIWLIIFGGYYLTLFFCRSFFLKKYSLARLENREVTIQYKDALVYILLGFSFMICSLTMYNGGNNTTFDHLTSIIIATIGFYKIIVAIIGMIKIRKSKNPFLILLKMVSLSDGAVALVLTQFALLTSENNENVNVSTGLFGLGIGFFISVLGLILLISTYKKIAK